MHFSFWIANLISVYSIIILLQITQHKWAWPFMQPVDVEGLGLRDYYEVALTPIYINRFIIFN